MTRSAITPDRLAMMSTSITTLEKNDHLRSIEGLLQKGGVRFRGLPIANMVIATLSLVALSISSYLAWTKLTAAKVVGCGSGGLIDCSHVLTTRWSTFLGVPVGICASVLYSVLIAAMLVRRYSSSRRSLLMANATIVTLGFSAGLAAVWFLSLQVFAIGHLCPWCIGAHVCGLGIAATLLWSRPFGRRVPRLPLALALAGVTMLISGQVVAEPPQSFEVQRFEPVAAPQTELEPGVEQDSSEPAVFAAPVFEPPVFEAPVENEMSGDADSSAGSRPDSPAVDDGSQVDDNSVKNEQARSRAEQAALPPVAILLLVALLCQTGAASALGADEGPESESKKAGQQVEEKSARLVSLGGKARLNVADWPLAGSPDAKHIFVEMFDYTCPHCRSTHQTSLKEMKRRYGDDVAYIALCVPLDASCNKFVQSTSAQHAEACELGKLAVAVWLADRKKFPEFHDWLFEGQQSRTAAQARQQAVELVGEERLQKMRATSTCSKYIERNVELYELVGAGSVPKLLFEDTVLVGTVNSADAIIQALK